MYYNGEETLKDFKQAFYWFSKSAETRKCGSTKHNWIYVLSR